MAQKDTVSYKTVQLFIWGNIYLFNITTSDVKRLMII